jgi:hypothetical protein
MTPTTALHTIAAECTEPMPGGGRRCRLCGWPVVAGREAECHREGCAVRVAWEGRNER